MSTHGTVSAVEAVIFDWGGTLTPWHTVDVAAQWQAFAHQVHREETEAASLARRILAAEEAAWRRGRTDHSSARLEDILDEADLDADEARRAAALAAYQKFWEPHTFTDPLVQPLWQRLHDRGIRVGVLSNTIWPGDYHREVFARDGVLSLIDGQVYSSEIAWAKPHPEAFRAVARAVGVAPARCVYVGDRLFEDIYGGHRAGMRTILIPHSDIPVGQRTTVDVAPDAVAHELSDVLGVVERWRSGD